MMLPASLKVHIYTVHKNPRPGEEKKPLTLEDIENQGKTKRAAATKAVTRMQEFIGDEEIAEDNDEESKDGLYESVGSFCVNNYMRGAWKRALISNGKVRCRHVGCTFDADSVQDIVEHYINCPLAPKKGYACRSCDFQCEDEPEMVNHVTVQHGSTLEQSDYTDSCDDDDMVSVNKTASQRNYFYGKNNKTSNRMRFLSKQNSGPVFGDRPYFPAAKWTFQYQVDNYLDTLFVDIHTKFDDWEFLNPSAAAQYLPEAKQSLQLCHLSMRHKVIPHPQRQTREMKWLNLFEVEVVNGIPTFFAGGPVWAMAWCSVPLKLTIFNNACVSQFLAVSVHKGMENVYVSGQSYAHSNMIQIWDFGHMDNKGNCPTPKHVMGIAHDYGTVWCLEWCPSDCYETPEMQIPSDRLRRLGLLAAACSDGTVRIFSVCFPSELKSKAGDNIPVFKIKAIRTLTLDLEDSHIQCTRLSWLKSRSHRIIAAGFSNGMVALYDVKNNSPLLSEGDILFPYHSFQAHIGVVSAVSLSPHGDGRFLMTGSLDRSIKFWDLEDTSTHITVNRKGSVTDGTWLTHWVSTINSLDDSYLLGHTNSTLTPVRNFGYNVYPLLAQNSVAWGVSACDWINAVAQGTEAGELTIIFSHQLLIAVDTEKGMKDKRMMRFSRDIISFIEMKDMDKPQEEYEINDSEDGISRTSNPASRASSVTPEDSVACDPDMEPGQNESDIDNVVVSKPAGPKYKTFEEAATKCGLILCDFPTYSFEQMPHEARLWMRQSDRMKPVDPDTYPVSSINRVSWNPNSRSFLWLAAGYQCGLVRVPCVSAMNCPYLQDILQQGERKVSAALNKHS